MAFRLLASSRLVLGLSLLTGCEALSGLNGLEVAGDGSGGGLGGDRGVASGSTGSTDGSGATDGEGATDGGGAADGGGATGGGATGGTGGGGTVNQCETDELAPGETSPGTCAAGWRASSECRGTCGDANDGLAVGCGRFMDCYVSNGCGPESCSTSPDDICGVNKVEGGNNGSRDRAQNVYECLCWNCGTGGTGGTGVTPSQPSCGAQYEAETDMQKGAGDSDDGIGWNFWGNGNVGVLHSFPLSGTIVVRAKAQFDPAQPSVAPQFKMTVAGAAITNNYEVSSLSYADYEFPYSGGAGNKWLQLDFQNDSTERNLWIDHIRIECPGAGMGGAAP